MLRKRPAPLPKGSKRQSQVKADKPKRPKKAKGAKGSFWGLVGVLTALAAAAVYGLQSARRRNRRVLDGMLAPPLHWTEHATCRMGCRFVGKRQVLDTLRRGGINWRKSEPALKPCPKYVVDAVVPAGGGGASGTSGSKAVQAVFIACPRETRVLTVIDRDTDWPCPPC